MALIDLAEARKQPEYGLLLDGFTHLKDVQLRSKWEREAGVYLAESYSVIERSLRAGNAPVAFLLTNKWVGRFASLLCQYTGCSGGGDVPVFIASEEETAELTGFPVHRGALALFARPAPTSIREILQSGGPRRTVAVLENLVDHANVGALFRSAAALGVSGVLVTPSCADPLYRRSIRVSMGAVFQVPWGRLAKWPDAELFHDYDFLLAALTPAEEAEDVDLYLERLDAAGGNQNLALMLGSEGPGLKEATIAGSDIRLRIPLSGGIDSLNVATAGALAFWEARRYRRNQSDPNSPTAPQ